MSNRCSSLPDFFCRSSRIAALAAVLLVQSVAAEESPRKKVSFRGGDGELVIEIGDQPIAAYVYRDEQGAAQQTGH